MGERKEGEEVVLGRPESFKQPSCLLPRFIGALAHLALPSMCVIA